MFENRNKYVYNFDVQNASMVVFCGDFTECPDCFESASGKFPSLSF